MGTGRHLVSKQPQYMPQMAEPPHPRPRPHLRNQVELTSFLKNFLFCIEIQTVNNVVMASGEQRRGPAMRVCVCAVTVRPDSVTPRTVAPASLLGP